MNRIKLTFYNKRTYTINHFTCELFTVDFVSVTRDFRVKCYILQTANGFINLPVAEYELEKAEVTHE